MPTKEDFFPSPWLKVDDLNGGATQYTIRTIAQETIGPDAEIKPVLYFMETDKGLIMNKTNFESVEEIHGRDTDGWRNKTITLYETTVEAFGERHNVIRVRVPSAQDELPLEAAGSSTDEIPF